MKKKRAAQTGTLIGVRLQPAVLARLDAWIRGNPDPKPSRPEAIRRLIELGLEAAKAENGGGLGAGS